MLNAPFELFALVSSYKNMVKNGQIPKENVRKALFTLAKIPFCEDDLQGKEYYDLLKFLTIAVEFYKAHEEVAKTAEQSLDMSRISNSKAASRPSKNISVQHHEKGWEDSNISSVMKYVQEDLFQGKDHHKKTEIIEKLKALQNRRSKSTENAANLLQKGQFGLHRHRASLHNIVNNVKERIKTLHSEKVHPFEKRRKSESHVRTHSSMMYPEDTEVEDMQYQISHDKITARDFRGKTKKLLADHDRFVTIIIN